VKDENGDLLADSHNILNRFLNIPRISDVRQIEIHAAEPLLPEPLLFMLKLLLQS
jgi:hypothetical protein